MLDPDNSLNFCRSAYLHQLSSLYNSYPAWPNTFKI